jgi:hypothetical protein
MSSISSVSPAIDPYQATNLNAFVQFVNNFNAIGNALQSGDLSEAQGALATFQQDLPGNASSQGSTSQPFGNNAKANTDFQSLAAALQSGDLTGAQKAYASLQDDLQQTSTRKSHCHHHHPSSNAATTTPPASTQDASESSRSGDALLNITA